MNELLKMILQMQMGSNQQNEPNAFDIPGFDGKKNALRSIIGMQMPYMNRNIIPNSNNVDMYY